MRSTTDDGTIQEVAASAVPHWVVFACAQHRFALKLERIREILDPPRYTPLPGCGPEVCGLISLRGRLITVIDLGAALGLGRSAARRNHALLLVQHRDGLAGLAVEQVIGVSHAPADALPLPGEALRSLDADRADILGVGELEGVPFLALEPDSVLRRLLS